MTTPATIAEIIAAVAARHGLTPAQLTGPQRVAPVVAARHEAMAEAHATGRWTMGQIGRAFGDRDHTTIAHAVRKIRRARQKREEAAQR